MSKSRAEIREYFHSPVDLGASPSADYVVAHADRQLKRGKNPSVKYKGHTNPRESLAAAKADIEARNNTDRYTDIFSGRIAIMRVWSEQHEQTSRQYGEYVMENYSAVGIILKELEDGETLQAPLHCRVDKGSVHVMLPLQNMSGN